MKYWRDQTVLKIVDGMAIVFGQAYQLVRARLLDTGSAVFDLCIQQDHAGEVELLHREIAILRDQRETMKPHRRPDYCPHHGCRHSSTGSITSWGGTTLNYLMLRLVVVRRMKCGTNAVDAADRVPRSR